jgi:hypothetical protein
MRSASSRTPFLMPLQLVAGARQGQDQEEVHHLGHHDLGLAHAYRLDDHHVVARGLDQQHGLPGHPADPAHHPARWRGPNEAFRIDGEPRHPGLVAEDRPAAARGGGIDREHGHLVILGCQHAAEAVDQRRLADAGHAGDTDPPGRRVDRVGHRQDRLQERLGRLAMLAPAALDQRDGARQKGAITPPDAVAKALERWQRRQTRLAFRRYSAAAEAWPSSRLSLSRRSIAASAMIVPGGKIALAPASISAG